MTVLSKEQEIAQEAMQYQKAYIRFNAYLDKRYWDGMKDELEELSRAETRLVQLGVDVKNLVW